jgi:hypothetical protein
MDVYCVVRILPLAAMVLAYAVAAEAEGFPKFKEHVINPDAGTGLAITVADVNGDGLKDIIGVSSDDVAWYENPTWERHLMTGAIKGSNVCVAVNDIDGDGLPEFALGADWQFNNTESGGALYLLQRKDNPEEAWDVITLLDECPTLHRVQWADVAGDEQKELVVAPLKGRDTTGPGFQERGVELFYLTPPANPATEEWPMTVIDNSLHVLHNIWPTRWEGTTKDAILAASFEGITLLRRRDGGWTSKTIAPGNPEPVPQSGAGEIKHTTAPLPMLATIEPWHGHQAVMYTLRDGAWERHVLDDSLAGGHAVWWADFDGDGDDELLVGFRDKAGPNNLPGLNVYDLHFEGDVFTGATKHVIDDGGMATEDALAVDINNDGLPDIVAFGRATKNIKYYENLGSEIE